MTYEELLRGVKLHRKIDELDSEIEQLNLLLADNDIPIENWLVDIRENASYTYIPLKHRGLLKSLVIQIRDKVIEEKTDAEREFAQL